MSDPVVLLISCDQFKDCWPAALACFERYWPDCPYSVRTMSNNRPWGKEPLLVGNDTWWTDKLRIALDLLGTELVITILDDMLISRPVDTAAVQRAVQFIAEGNQADVPTQTIGAVRLGQGAEVCDGLRTSVLDADRWIPFDRVSRDSDYRISTSPTLWRADYLRRIIGHCGETAWAFEHNGTEYAKELPEEVWTIHGDTDISRPVRCYYTGILRGKWVGECLEWLDSLGIPRPNTDRGVTWLRDK